MANLIEELLLKLHITSTPWINALLTVAFFIIIAILVNLLIIHVLKRLVKFTKSDLDDKIIDILHKPIYLTIILFSLSYAINYLMFFFEVIDKNSDAINYPEAIISTIVTIIWFFAVLKTSDLIVFRGFKKLSDVSGMRQDIIPLIGNVARIAIAVAAIMALLSIWHIDITPLLASAGILGIAIAMAAKDTLANFFGGISVFLDKPYKIGDYVELDQQERGEVVDIGIRSTRIKTRDDILISIPNSIIANSKILNESAPIPKFRVRVPVGVSYGSDIDLVEKVLIQVALENDNIVEDPEPRARFREFGDSSLNFELLCWAEDPARRGETQHELNRAVYKIFAANNINIPFPQRDLHIIRGEDKD